MSANGTRVVFLSQRTKLTRGELESLNRVVHGEAVLDFHPIGDLCHHRLIRRIKEFGDDTILFIDVSHEDLGVRLSGVPPDKYPRFHLYGYLERSRQTPLLILRCGPGNCHKVLWRAS